MADLATLIIGLLGNWVVMTLIIVRVVIYMGSCVIHPYRTCKACNRSKESYSTNFKGAFGMCRVCRGVGHHLRFGARLLGKKL